MGPRNFNTKEKLKGTVGKDYYIICETSKSKEYLDMMVVNLKTIGYVTDYK